MIKIISDSSTLYSVKEANKNDIDISTLTVTINDKTYKEYEEITTPELIDIIKEGHMPISSQPAVGEVVEVYNKYKDYEIINISMADGLSGTYSSACMAKDLAENPENIEVINSRTLCGPQRYLLDLAAKLVELGESKETIIEEINKLIDSSKSFLIPKDFDYLIRGGRVSSLVGKIGGAIKLVPVMTLSEDSTKVIKFTTKRTFSKAIDVICEEFLKCGADSNYKIYICHADSLELSEAARNAIIEKIKNADVEIKMLSPVFTTHAGPGGIAIQMIKKHPALL